jgi:flagellar biosynthesis/type III secretory pathway chaperone
MNAPKPAMDATKRVSDMIVILERFAQILEEENAFLRDRKVDEVKALLEDKAALSRVYESRARGLLEHGDELPRVDAKLRERLKELNAQADVLVAENAKLLKVAIEVQKRVVEVIRVAVKEAQIGPKTYSKSGGTTKRNDRRPAPPMAINKSL